MEKPEVVRSLYNDQFKILESILKLHVEGNTFDVDLTYGNGAFYKKGIPQPKHRLDIDDSLENITKANTFSNMKQKVFDYENDCKAMEDQITQQSSVIKKLEEKIQEIEK